MLRDYKFMYYVNKNTIFHTSACRRDIEQHTDPITNPSKLIGGKWKIAIIYNSIDKSNHFGEVKICI
ncbi:MAG: hypothetical protein CMD92_10195 [Gammaproteobacteria bacterium]|nr:hypothetical protein [Gammaproteobacteria bacterium]HBW84167.1 hypothetical protein [Gammaproteobacteria bacterium]